MSLLLCHGPNSHLQLLDTTATPQGENPLGVPGKTNSSLIFSILKASLLKAHGLLDGSWIFLQRMTRASGPVLEGDLATSFPVRPSWVSSTDSLWHLAIPPEIWMDSAPLEWRFLSTLCTSVHQRHIFDVAMELLCQATDPTHARNPDCPFWVLG